MVALRALVMHKLLLGVIFALLSSRALAELPNQTDLKSAYCIAALDEQIKLINASSVTEAEESKKIAINNLNTKIKRMQLYLLPRLPNIELTGIIIAKETARADVKKATNELKPCILACGLNHFECIEQCPTSESSKHLESCDSISFLPY